MLVLEDGEWMTAAYPNKTFHNPHFSFRKNKAYMNIKAQNRLNLGLI